MKIFYAKFQLHSCFLRGKKNQNPRPSILKLKFFCSRVVFCFPTLHSGHSVIPASSSWTYTGNSSQSPSQSSLFLMSGKHKTKQICPISYLLVVNFVVWGC